MKKLYLLSILSFTCFFPSAQTTVTFTLNTGDEDATVDDYNPNNNSPDEIEYFMGGWTINGTNVTWRNLLKFDLTSIPQGAIVQSAKLSLFYPSQNNFQGNDTSLTSSNESLLQRVTSSWSENSVTWNTQPSATTQDEVDIPQSISGNQDYPNLDVTAMVQQMVNDPSTNFGFMLRLVNETPYARMLFGSGDNPDPADHPVLVVTYTNCISQTLDADGTDATIDDYSPANNYPNEIEYYSGAWTINATPVTWRNLFQFNLSAIPANATVTSADLSLYYATINSFGGGDTSLTNSNESVLQRITSSWAEDAVTWNNQPSSSNQNEVIIPASVGNQDYPGIDVTAMVQDMVNDPANSFGFLLKLTNENYYARMLFASGDNPDANEHPRLDVCWTINEGVSTINDANNISINPNPSSGIFSLKWNETSPDFTRMKITNSIGQIVMEQEFNSTVGANTNVLDVSFLPKGVYTLGLDGKSNQLVKKLVIQ